MTLGILNTATTDFKDSLLRGKIDPHKIFQQGNAKICVLEKQTL